MIEISDAIEAQLVRWLVDLTKDRRDGSALALSCLEKSRATVAGYRQVVTADDLRAELASMDEFIADAESELAVYAASH